MEVAAVLALDQVTTEKNQFLFWTRYRVPFLMRPSMLAGSFSDVHVIFLTLDGSRSSSVNSWLDWVKIDMVGCYHCVEIPKIHSHFYVKIILLKMKPNTSLKSPYWDHVKIWLAEKLLIFHIVSMEVDTSEGPIFPFAIKYFHHEI